MVIASVKPIHISLFGKLEVWSFKYDFACSEKPGVIIQVIYYQIKTNYFNIQFQVTI